MVDVEQRALRALEQDAIAGACARRRAAPTCVHVGARVDGAGLPRERTQFQRHISGLRNGGNLELRPRRVNRFGKMLSTPVDNGGDNLWGSPGPRVDGGWTTARVITAART